MARAASSAERRKATLVGWFFFVASFFCGFVALLAAMRFVFFLYNAALSDEVPRAAVVWAFVVGLRFDALIASYASLPAALLMFAAHPDRWVRFLQVYTVVVTAIIVFLGVVEIDFYAEFHQRLNDLAFRYLAYDPETVISMVARGFPVVQRLVLLALLLGLFGVAGCFLVDRASVLKPNTAHPIRARRVGCFVVVLMVLVIVARGRIGPGPPLRWGDSHFSEHPFANHLGLNAPFSLVTATRWSLSNNAPWRRLYASTSSPLADAARVITMLAAPTDRPLAKAAARRYHETVATGDAPRHLIVILMESFAARFVGALRGYPEITPEFDALASQGTLFTRFFSNGTHTHQGTFATLACFPNLPGYEYLMEQPEGARRFSGFHSLLHERFDDMVYLYNGDFRWDNQLGFFRSQGLDDFIGRDDYEHPRLEDPTWGVADEDMFERALAEIDRRTSRGSVFAVLQTLSNHTPFALPDPPPVPPVTDAGRLNDRLTAMRYADWALGEFFRVARERPYYQDTLFVLVGDHGFSVGHQVEDLDLDRFHVPLLLLGRVAVERLGSRVTRVASQVDIVPTVMELLGQSYRGQCWGRDQATLSDDDQGFAVIKPSGTDPMVGMLADENLLIDTPHARNLYRWQVATDFVVRPLDDAGEIERLDADLRSYLSAASAALISGDVGP